MAGNIESLKDIMAFNRTQPDGDEEDVENNLCPFDNWTLDTNAKGEKSCPICGRVWIGNKLILFRGR